MPILLATAYFPPVDYLAAAFHADEIIIEAFETYTKQTYRNHCSIYGPNGKHTLSIPVVKKNGNHTLTKDILLSEHQPWQKIHWRSIETAYNNSPFFLYYQDLLVSFFEKDFRYLLDLNLEIFSVLLQILKITRPVSLTEKFEKTPADIKDLRTVSGAKHLDIHAYYPPYTQVFEPRHGFIPGLSILDVIFNLGPETVIYLESINAGNTVAP
ncbi:MAG: WbqC family protein [Bacteroidetes bacterium]|nr:WbqC family protein [Bacteroidota bacterium]